MDNIILIMPSIHADRVRPDFDSSKGHQPYNEPNFPLSITYLGSYLEANGYRVKIIDMRRYNEKDTIKVVADSLPGTSIVGISVMTSSVREALRLSKLIKSIDSNVKVIWGGIHPTLFPEQTVRNRVIDFVVVGEGEIPMLKLVKNIFTGAPKLEEINNIAYKNRDGYQYLFKKDFLNLNEIPIPGYHLLDTQKYIIRRIWNRRLVRCLEIQTSRGCPNVCTFCVNPLISKRTWRAQDPDKVISDLGILILRYNINHIFFFDENFFVDKKRIEKLIVFFMEKKITWEATCRADYFCDNYLNEKFMGILKRSGCSMLRIGVESGSERILRMLKKDVTTVQIERAISLCKRYKIQPMISYMIGLPTETKSEIIKTLKFVYKLQGICPRIIHSGPQLFRPYPGSELYKFCLKRGFAEPGSLEGWADLKPDLSGYHDSLAWVTDNNFVKSVIYLTPFLDRENRRLSPHQVKRGYRKALYYFFEKTVNFRYRYGCWGLLLEGLVIDMWLKIKKIIK